MDNQSRPEIFKDIAFPGKDIAEVKDSEIDLELSNWLVSALQELQTITDDPAPIYHANFPVGLSAGQRKHIHKFAFDMKLKSTSHGEGSARVIRVTLDNHRNLSMQAAKLTSSDSLEQAIAQREEKKHSKIPKGMSLILDYLYLGSGKDARDKETLKAAGVSIILNVTAEWSPYHTNDFTFHRIPLNDTASQSLSDAIQHACDVIKSAKEANAKVLVHCVMGMSRSASLVMAYLVTHENMTLKEAFYHTKTIRPIVKPNTGFMQDLIQLEIQIRGEASMDVESWVQIVGIHGSERNFPKKIAAPSLSKQQAKEASEEMMTKWLTEEKLESIVNDYCVGTFSVSVLQNFLTGLKKSIESDKPFVKSLEKEGLLVSDAARAAREIAKPWFMKRIPKN